MNSPQYRVFICSKQRRAHDPKGCCSSAGASAIYQAFQNEVQKRQLSDRIEVLQSGCLDRCESGVVALVYQPRQNEFSWLATKLRLKLRRLFIPKRWLYGHLTCLDIPAIIDSHLKGQSLKRCQILSDE